MELAMKICLHVRITLLQNVDKAQKQSAAVQIGLKLAQRLLGYHLNMHGCVFLLVLSEGWKPRKSSLYPKIKTSCSNLPFFAGFPPIPTVAVV